MAQDKGRIKYTLIMLSVWVRFFEFCWKTPLPLVVVCLVNFSDEWV